MHPLAAKLFHENFGMLLVSKTEAVRFPPALGLALPFTRACGCYPAGRTAPRFTGLSG